jgi:hypothetical protein
MDLLEELNKIRDLLNKALSEYKKRGIEYANAYKNYRVAVAKELLRLKDEGVAVTIAYDVARGKEDIAELKRQEIITECVYKSCQEAINSYKLQLKIVQEQINKEYGNLERY